MPRAKACEVYKNWGDFLPWQWGAVGAGGGGRGQEKAMLSILKRRQFKGLWVKREPQKHADVFAKGEEWRISGVLLPGL